MGYQERGTGISSKELGGYGVWLNLRIGKLYLQSWRIWIDEQNMMVIFHFNVTCVKKIDIG